MSKIYNLSKDYKKLYDLVMAGHKIPCYVTYDLNNGRGTKVSMTADLTECKVLDKDEDFEQIVLSTRGHSFMNLYTKVEGDDIFTDFVTMCESYDLQFILPNEEGVKAWIARDGDGGLYLYLTKPNKGDEIWCIDDLNRMSRITDTDLPDGINPQWSDDEPIEVELTIERAKL